MPCRFNSSIVGSTTGAFSTGCAGNGSASGALAGGGVGAGASAGAGTAASGGVVAAGFFAHPGATSAAARRAAAVRRTRDDVMTGDLLSRIDGTEDLPCVPHVGGRSLSPRTPHGARRDQSGVSQSPPWVKRRTSAPSARIV